jgi:hypothetical protein
MNASRLAPPKPTVKVADEVWIATALLHQEFATAPDFPIEAIVKRAEREAIAGALRPGVYVHVLQHCVANRPPDPGRYRMLFETAPGRRRLFRPGDPYNLKREGSKTIPAAEDLPKGYESLRDWYASWASNPGASIQTEDPLMRMARIGKHIWQDEDPDEYIKQLREGWE